MTTLTLFGLLAVSAMLLFYALEDRAARYVLLFAAACLASSIYGFLQGAWPFGIVEAVWTGVAVRRWRHRVVLAPEITSQPIACDMSALSDIERERYKTLRRGIVNAIEQVVDTPAIYRLRLNGSIAVPEAAEWIALERRCCPFLNLGIELKGDGTTWIHIGGSQAVKAFVAAEFAFAKAFGT